MSAIRLSIDLRLAIILLVLVPLLTVLGVGGLFVFAALENRLEARLQEDIALIARTLKQPMARAVDRNRADVTQQALSSAYEFGRVYGVYVYDASGELITGADRLGARPDFRVDHTELRGLSRDEELGDYRSMGGQEVFSYFTPLTAPGGQVIGMLQITRQVSEMRDYMSELRWQALSTLIAFSVVFIGIVIIGHHVAIGRPLSLLTRTMDRVTGGDNRARAAVKGPKEMQQLSRRFNLMLGGIDDRDRRLRDQHRKQAHLSERLRETEKYALAGRLAAGMAHELGTPLSVVDGHLQRLIRDQTEETGIRRTLVDMQAATRRMAEVIGHLLGFGQAPSAPRTRLSVSKLIRLAAADTRSRFNEPKTMPELSVHSPDAFVAGDQSRLREALSHLLSNAMHAAAGGRVCLSWKPAGESVNIVVADSGPGIAAADRERIFEPFFTTKKPGDGSGLGLSVVRGIVAGHDGSVSVSASDLGGAEFTISLPSAGGQ